MGLATKGNLERVRAAALATAILVPLGALGQQTDPALVAPDLILNIREHETTADIIEARARDPLVAPERLARSAHRLGEFSGSPPRGLDASRIAVAGPLGTKVARVYFATDNIVDRSRGTVDLTSIVQAFCDPTGKPPIKNLAIVLDGERPVANLSLKGYSDKLVWMRAAASVDPPGIEIRISLQTDSLEGVRVPYRGDEGLPRKPEAETEAGLPAIVWVLLATAGVAAGALVYSLLARRPRR
ncbi:MAG: hypothetical protein AB7F50_10200 [Fimbriimonadaceae bacterium]